MAVWPLEPLRPPPDLYFGKAQNSTELGVPNILDLVCRLTESDYLFYLPVKNLGWNLGCLHTDKRLDGEMCTPGAALAEQEALSDGFMVERQPSLVEVKLRLYIRPDVGERSWQATPHASRGLRATAVAQDEKLWKALQQLGYPMVANPSYSALLAQCCVFNVCVMLLPLDPKVKLKDLFKHGVPELYEKLEDDDTIDKLRHKTWEAYEPSHSRSSTRHKT
ncbi:hypothetical protein SELMODRAFT_408845 [Selaginella moellendorffii]|uniref:Uncharacterized protein n=1 Tax=Selaginella moellendorffii TaxID=88036 RepID=D8RA52_SELML|nr:hypothetical protein SELMODRAFT_408845 [Selaginella moellendorffii]